MENNIEEGQGPLARAAHHREDASVAPAPPAARTPPSDAPEATSEATIAFFCLPLDQPLMHLRLKLRQQCMTHQPQ